MPRFIYLLNFYFFYFLLLLMLLVGFCWLVCSLPFTRGEPPGEAKPEWVRSHGGSPCAAGGGKRAQAIRLFLCKQMRAEKRW